MNQLASNLSPSAVGTARAVAAVPFAFALLGALTGAQVPVDANYPPARTAANPAAAPLAPPGFSGPAAVNWSDNFNRPDSTNMGPDWSEYSGDQVILNNHGQGNLNTGWSYMLHNTAAASPASARMQIDMLPPSGSSGPHVALIAGAAPAATQWYYTKIQDNNSDGAYDRIFFYSNGNGGGWGASYFMDLTQPIATGRVFMYFSNGGDTLNVDIDVDFNGSIDQSYANSGALAVPVAGTGFGIGTWAMGSYDNWRAADCSPAATRAYGIGFPGTNGVPAIAGTNPVLGTTVSLTIGNSLGATTGGAVVIGGRATSIPVFWGGTLLVAPDVVLSTTIPTGGLTLGLRVPGSSLYCGASLFVQGVVVDAGAARGIANTQGLELILGS